MKPQEVAPCYTMLLAPFQPATRIELETVINTSIECSLNIRNPCNKTLHITVTKVPPSERHIILTSYELDIPANTSGLIHMKWTPIETGCWRDILQLTDNRRVKYDIHVATTSKAVNKSSNSQKRTTRFSARSSSINIAASISTQLQRNTASTSTFNQPLIADVGTNQCGPKFKSESNKENICNKNSETKTDSLQEKNGRDIGNHCLNKEKYILSEQITNVWNDSVLPQVLLPSNGLQDSRRATYVKERQHCCDMLYKPNKEKKEVSTDTTKPQSDFSMLLDRFTLAPANEIGMSSPRSANHGDTVESSQNPGKQTTLNISPEKSFVSSAPTEINTMPSSNNAGFLSQFADPHNLSPIKFDGRFLTTDDTDIISSSPIAHLCGVSKDPSEFSKRIVTDTSNSGVQRTLEDYFTFEVIPEERKAEDIYIEISPPKKNLSKAKTATKCNPRLGRVLKKAACDSGKVLHVNATPKRKLEGSSPSDTSRKTNKPAIKVSRLTLNTLRQTKWHSSSCRESTKIIHRKDEIFTREKFELDPFAPSTTEDPFLKKVRYHDEEWMLRQELAFTKWLNALLSAPEELSVDIETAVVDVGKVWQSCKALKDTLLAETKEAVSARYHTSARLNTLRKAASAMYARDEIAKILSSTSEYIAKGTLPIRSDRNLQRDIGLQKFVLSLFLSYNPLWLRIGLETVYGESIPLRSNNDIIGLTRFLLTRFFLDSRLARMPGYHKTNPSQKFVASMNQFIVRKFLFLVYFLDYAKQHKLIGHDPCLFRKRSEYKESRHILLSFSREVISGIGDITKVLRSHNYLLTYRQAYIEEYDYAVTNIRYDLRDGVRLCRAMELITGARGLTQSCRVPAISRLQKIHNADVALNALRNAGYVLEGDIDAKSIADGHCEKTLSLLWQIIYKYQVPRFDRSARVIQRWWRAQLWYINVRNFLRARRHVAALTIQRAWRLRETLSLRNVDCNLEERKQLLCARTAAIKIQRWWRNLKETRMYREMLQEAKKRRRAVIVIQRRWRATLMMKIQRNEFLRMRNATLTIQARWRATRSMKLQRSEYLAFRNAAVTIQSWWRSLKIMREQRKRFLYIRESTCIIQGWWRRCLVMRRARNNFLLIKVSVRVIERWWISVLDRKKFLLYRESAIVIQRVWRNYRARKRETACLTIQTWWRAAICLRENKLRESSCAKLQRWWRGVVLTRRLREEFLQLRHATLTVQKNWRAKMARRRYLEQRRAALLIQSWYRRTKSAQAVRRHYLEMRNAAIKIQTWWRGVLRARADRQRYLGQRDACVTLQSWWRITRQTKEYNQECMRTRAAIVLQAYWRGFIVRRRYIALRQAAVVVQSHYRMIIAVRRYKIVKRAVLTIQIHWRAYIAGKRQRSYYLQLRQTVIMLQRRFRQNIAKREELCRQQREESLATKIRDECGEAIEVFQEDSTNMARPDSAYWQQVIDAIQNCSDLGVLLVYLSNLDTVTKLSPTVRSIFCEMNLVDNICNMIVHNNRSMPWMKICLRACSILITLAKDADTRKYVLKEEHSVTLVKLLSVSLKHKDVFLHCATLIWLLSQDEDYCKTLATCPQINWLLQSIQQKTPKSLKPKSAESKLDKNNTTGLLFTDVNSAVAAIIKNISDVTL